MSRRNPASAESAPGAVSPASWAMPFHHPYLSAPGRESERDGQHYEAVHFAGSAAARMLAPAVRGGHQALGMIRGGALTTGDTNPSTRLRWNQMNNIGVAHGDISWSNTGGAAINGTGPAPIWMTHAERPATSRISAPRVP